MASNVFFRSRKPPNSGTCYVNASCYASLALRMVMPQPLLAKKPYKQSWHYRFASLSFTIFSRTFHIGSTRPMTWKLTEFPSGIKTTTTHLVCYEMSSISQTCYTGFKNI